MVFLAATATSFQIGAFVGAIILVIGVTAWLLVRRRRNVWKQVAAGRQLAFAEHPEGPRISGTLNGRPVQVTTAESGSDTGAGVAVVCVSVALEGVPGGMSAQGVPGLIGDLATLGQDRIETGCEAFDRDVQVKHDDDEWARSYWNEPRREVFLQLVQSAPCDQIAIRDGTLVAELRSIVSDRRQLENLLDQLVAAAAQLDATRHTE